MTKFTYDQLTIRDLRSMLQASEDGNMLPLLEVMARCTDSDIYALPMKQMNDLVRQFSTGLAVHVQKLQDIRDEESVPDAIKLLRTLFKDTE